MALAGAVLFAGGVLIGFAADAVVFSRSSPVERDEEPALFPVIASPGGGDALAPALAELSKVLASLRETLDRPQPAPPLERVGQRTPVGEPSPPADSGELAAAIHALATAVRKMPGSGASTSAPADLVVPAWIDRGRAFSSHSTPLMSAAKVDDEETMEAARRALRRQHLFWSQQDVLDKYGAPDEIYSDDGALVWCYMVRNSETKLTEDYDFHFHDGAVARVDFDYWD